MSITLSVNSPTGQTPQRIFTVDSLKDVDLRKDVPLTTEFLRWSYGLGGRERQICPFFGNDARFTALAQAARRSISGTMLAGHMN